MASSPVRGLLAACAISLALAGCGSFPMASRDPGAGLGDQECLARVMYFESNRSSEDGMLAVGTVVMNRLQSPRYPKSVCAVVGQQNQFADGALSQPIRRDSSWARAQRVAEAVLGGQRHAGVGAAMFFHTAGHTFPYRNMRYVTLAGGNVFYEKRYPAPGAPAWAPATMLAEARPERARPEPGAILMSGGTRQEVRPTSVATAPVVAKPKPIVVAALSDRKERPSRAPLSIAALIAMTD